MPGGDEPVFRGWEAFAGAGGGFAGMVGRGGNGGAAGRAIGGRGGSGVGARGAAAVGAGVGGQFQFQVGGNGGGGALAGAARRQLPVGGYGGGGMGAAAGVGAAGGTIPAGWLYGGGVREAADMAEHGGAGRAPFVATEGGLRNNDHVLSDGQPWYYGRPIGFWLRRPVESTTQQATTGSQPASTTTNSLASVNYDKTNPYRQLLQLHQPNPPPQQTPRRQQRDNDVVNRELNAARGRR
ncbi:hypothetical protein VPH35_127342 [Triticum aestivum]|uniref:glycine-rich cell wall structural protein n=1 Tax=Triticum aestivum TaxID=4565 RepID=UPI001D00C3DF|nr:glycine-rich cell wall structural protein-like [Triticum aestivum]